MERDRAVPAFPSGFGLSYTTFELDHLRLPEGSLNTHDTLMVTLDVTNCGSVSGDIVLQMYVSVPILEVERALKELKAFKRVRLGPGETKTIHLDIPGKELAYYDMQSGWTVEPTSYTLIVGQHSLDDQAFRAAFKII